MASYLVNKNPIDGSVVKIKDTDGYTFRPRVKKDEYIKVSEVTIVDKQMIDRILSTKFDKSFKQLISLANYVINDDDSDEGDCEIVINQVELLRQILLYRYQKFINYDKEQLFLKKLRLIENEMRLKQIEIKQKAIYLEEMERQMHGMGR